METTTIKNQMNHKFFKIMNIIRFIIIFNGIIMLILAIISFSANEPIYIGEEAINLMDDGKLMSDFNIYGKIIICVIIGTIFILFPLSRILGQTVGTARANHKNKKDMNFIKKINPYIYYRDLPNNYGIGVCTLLIDSAIENEKDIVAAILDLCAKKYLMLEKNQQGYIIHVLKRVDDKSYLTQSDIENKLLLNEKYILQCINNNSLKIIDYAKWYSLCLKDGKNLNLYFDKPVERMKGNFNAKTPKKVFFIVVAVLMIAGVVLSFFTALNNSDGNKLLGVGIFVGCLPLILFTAYLLSSLATGFLLIVRSLFTGFSRYQKYFYNAKIGMNLTLTDHGMTETQKMYAFEQFIKDFSTFAEKNIDEIVLWDRYLSYAQVFGLTDTIIKSGYKQLINNSSFKIDAIDNIKINDIEIV